MRVTAFHWAEHILSKAAIMSILNQGRNEIRVNNSGAKCLLENWVEEVGVDLKIKIFIYVLIELME